MVIDDQVAAATFATGIDSHGDIVGRYVEANCAAGPACIHGFLYRHGQFTKLSFDGHPGAFAQRIEPDGRVYGCLHDFDLMQSMFGAVWTSVDSGYSLTAGGGELANASESVPASMNNGATPGGKVIVGFFTDASTNVVHGFTVREGALEVYDVAGARLTQIWDIDPEEQFVGTYVDATGVQHGFLQFRGLVPAMSIDFPGASATAAFGMNPEEQIVGRYVLNGRSHGFLASPHRPAGEESRGKRSAIPK